MGLSGVRDFYVCVLGCRLDCVHDFCGDKSGVGCVYTCENVAGGWGIFLFREFGILKVY